MTFAVVAGSGWALIIGIVLALRWLGTPTWVTVLPWLVPTVGAVAWAVFRPTPAVATDDDDDSWTGYAIQYVIIGETTPRGAPTRAIAAGLFGAPVIWSLAVFGLSTLAGLF